MQENKSIYLSIYLSIWKPFWKRVYIYIYIYTPVFKKVFIQRDIYIDIYFCSLARAPVCIYTCYCPTCEKTWLNDKFSFRQVLCSNLSVKKMGYEFGLRIRWRRITRGSASSRDVFLIPKISHIIRHCKFVSQGACIFLKKKLKTTCQIGTKNPTTKKFTVEPSFSQVGQ